MAKDKKFLQDEWNGVSSELSVENKWVLASLTDSENVEKSFERKSALVEELLAKLQQDENTLNDVHQKLTRLIADWTGDFQKEIRASGSKGVAEQIYAFMRQFSDVEKKVNADFTNTKSMISNIRSQYENMTVKAINEKTHAELVGEFKSLVSMFAQWLSYDKELSDIVSKCNNFIKTYDANSPEFANYGNIDEKLNDLFEGKGVYSSYSVEQRKAILARYERSNEYALKKRQDVINRINAFMKEGGMTSDLVFEEKKTGNSMYFNESLDRLRKAGFKRHLRPVEYFEILADVEANGTASPHFELRKNLWSGYGEWLSMAVMLKDGILHIALDPENIAWNSKKGQYEYAGQASINIPAPQLKANDWNENISEFTNYFGVGCKGIYLNREGVWGPVGCGDSNGYGSFILYAGDGKRASRGVK